MFFFLYELYLLFFNFKYHFLPVGTEFFYLTLEFPSGLNP